MTIYCAAFVFEPGEYDADFHRLNALVEATARSLPGFLGVESWVAVDGARRNATYYWDSLETLRAFSTDPVHQQAKREYARWYKGYHIVVSEVLRSYGDGAFGHVTPNARAHTT
jgi:heme-degrading monooxygenase HmoA